MNIVQDSSLTRFNGARYWDGHTQLSWKYTIFTTRLLRRKYDDTDTRAFRSLFG